jgi:molecular chaperone GrpE
VIVLSFVEGGIYTMPKQFDPDKTNLSTDDNESETESRGGEATNQSAQLDSAGSGSIEARLAEKENELAELKDQYLRTLAESENIRRRLRQQSDETIRLQREGFLRDLLPIVDNLERAIGAASGGGNGKSIVEGVELVLRSLLDFLKGHGVTPLDVAGQPFDPQRHEAVAQVESKEHPPNTVINEFHRGYSLGDRMLRPARVSVAAGEKRSPDGSGNGEDNG